MQMIFKLFFILLLCVVLPINSNAKTISIDVEASGATNSKRNLVISKFDTKGLYQCAGSRINTSDIKNDINQILIENFTNTRRFNILDRDNFDVYQKEKNIILSDDADLKEASRLGNIVGTDYVITGNIKNISINRNIEQIELTGESIETRTASITIDYRIILISNMHIEKTDTIKITLGNQVLSKKAFNCNSIRYELLKEVANKIVNSSIEAIYPALVIKVSDDRVYINQAEGTVKVGDLWDIFSLGEALIDPYSGEKLGEEEILVATIKISEIKPKFSIGKVVYGDLKDIYEKQICRRKEKNVTKNKGKKIKSENKPEVFKLPFDDY